MLCWSFFAVCGKVFSYQGNKLLVKKKMIRQIFSLMGKKWNYFVIFVAKLIERKLCNYCFLLYFHTGYSSHAMYGFTIGENRWLSKMDYFSLALISVALFTKDFFNEHEEGWQNQAKTCSAILGHVASWRQRSSIQGRLDFKFFLLYLVTLSKLWCVWKKNSLFKKITGSQYTIWHK